MGDTFNPAPVSVMKHYDDDGQPFYENHIITADYDIQEQAVELPKFIRISNLKPGELPFMKLRSPQVLRYHKFNREKSPHEYYYSELQLYHPHLKSKSFHLEKEKEDFEACQDTYLNS